MSATAATYTCDECGYQAAERALVIAHLRVAHGITDTAEVGSVTQQAGMLILRSDDHETVIDLDAWLREHLPGLVADGAPVATPSDPKRATTEGMK